MINRCEVGICKTYIGEHMECVYKYYLTEKPLDINSRQDILSINSYGIEIVSEKVLNGIVIDSNEDTIEYVSPFKGKVLDLIKCLQKNEVSPLHLVDTVCDKVDNWIEDFDIGVQPYLVK